MKLDNEAKEKSMNRMDNAQITVSLATLDWIISMLDNNKQKRKLLEIRRKDGLCTYNELITISDESHISLGYFFLNKPLKLERPVFREEYDLQKSNLQCDLLFDVIRKKQSYVREYAKEYFGDPAVFRNNYSDLQPHYEKYDLIFEMIEYGNACKECRSLFLTFREFLTSCGVLIFQYKLVPETKKHLPKSFIAYSLFDKYAPAIVLNAGCSFRQRCIALIRQTIALLNHGNSIYLENVNKSIDDNISIITDRFVGKCDLLSISLGEEHYSDYALKIANRKFNRNFITLVNLALTDGEIMLTDALDLLECSASQYEVLEEKARKEYYECQIYH